MLGWAGAVMAAMLDREAASGCFAAGNRIGEMKGLKTAVSTRVFHVVLENLRPVKSRHLG